MKRFPLLLSVLLVVLSVNTIAQDEIERVETNLVTINVGVTDRSGNIVRGLNKADFTVLDNGAAQEIETFSTGDAAISYGIVFDMHGATDDRTRSVLTAITQFAADIRPQDDLFVTVFNDRGSLTTDFAPTEEHLRRNLDSTGGSAPISLYDSIFAASEKVRRMKNPKKVLVVLTDGADRSSHHSLSELRQHLRRINLPIYSMTFGDADRRQFSYSDIAVRGPRQTLGASEISALDKAAIEDLSKSSGGATVEYSIRNSSYITAMARRMTADVQGQYVIGFYPETLDGKWHKLEVQVKDGRTKRYRIVNRTGYLSPRPAPEARR